MSENTTVIAEAYRLAELRLQSQFSAAIAADQRAIGLAGMLVAAAAVLAGLAPSAPWALGMLIGSAGLAIAALMACISALPQSFFVPGALFEDLKEDIENGADLGQVQKELGGFHDKHSMANDRLMKRNSKLVQSAVYLAILSVTVVIAGQIWVKV